MGFVSMAGSDHSARSAVVVVYVSTEGSCHDARSTAAVGYVSAAGSRHGAKNPMAVRNVCSRQATVTGGNESNAEAGALCCMSYFFVLLLLCCCVLCYMLYVIWIWLWVLSAGWRLECTVGLARSAYWRCRSITMADIDADSGY
jgi:hypothetical protein